MKKKTKSRAQETKRRTGQLMWGDEDNAQAVARLVPYDDGDYGLILNRGVVLDSRDRALLWIRFDPA